MLFYLTGIYLWLFLSSCEVLKLQYFDVVAQTACSRQSLCCVCVCCYLAVDCHLRTRNAVTWEQSFLCEMRLCDTTFDFNHKQLWREMMPLKLTIIIIFKFSCMILCSALFNWTAIMSRSDAIADSKLQHPTERSLSITFNPAFRTQQWSVAKVGLTWTSQTAKIFFRKVLVDWHSSKQGKPDTTGDLLQL